jgi:hypothetical protein
MRMRFRNDFKCFMESLLTNLKLLTVICLINFFYRLLIKTCNQREQLLILFDAYCRLVECTRFRARNCKVMELGTTGSRTWLFRHVLFRLFALECSHWSLFLGLSIQTWLSIKLFYKRFLNCLMGRHSISWTLARWNLSDRLTFSSHRALTTTYIWFCWSWSLCDTCRCNSRCLSISTLIWIYSF